MNDMTTERSAAGQYLAGHSGNPGGRPKGARNKKTRFEELLEDWDPQDIASKVVELAKEGDIRMLKLCMDRLFPVERHRRVSFEMPDIDTAEKLPDATAALLNAVAEGELSPAEATELAKLVGIHICAIEATDAD